MANDDRERWNRRYREEPRLAALSPSPLLVAHAELLPAAGRALDLACGSGRNALFLASRGLATTGIDIAGEGLALARRAAAGRGLSLELVEADLDPGGGSWLLGRARWDLIVCNHYLERALFPAIEAALRPGGTLFFETFVRDQLAFPEAHPRREEFLLAPNELLRAFPTLRVVHYEESTRRLPAGERAVLATLFAREPSGDLTRPATDPH